MKIFLLVLTLICFIFPCFAQKNKIVATVNGENIFQKELNDVLIKSCGEGAEDLKDEVAKAYLSEMVLFKVIEQYLKKVNVTIDNTDEYEEDADRYAQPFLIYYVEWGLKNQLKFIKDLQSIISKSTVLQKKHGEWLKMAEFRVISNDDMKRLLEIWQDIINTKEFKAMLRERICQKYRLDYAIFKERIRLITKLRMFIINSHLKDEEIRSFAQKEKFALSDGLIRLKHLFLAGVDLETMEAFTKEKEAEIVKKIWQIRQEIKPDLSNFDEKVAQYSDHKSNKFQKGDLGWVPRWSASTIFSGFLTHLGWLPPVVDEFPEILSVGFQLPEKTLSQPIKSKWGLHLLVVAERKPGEKELSESELLKRSKNMLALLKMEQTVRLWVEKSKIQYPD